MEETNRTIHPAQMTGGNDVSAGSFAVFLRPHNQLMEKEHIISFNTSASHFIPQRAVLVQTHHLRPQTSHLPNRPSSRRGGRAHGCDSQRGGIGWVEDCGARRRGVASDPCNAGCHDERAAKSGGGGEALAEDEEAEDAGPDWLGGVEQRRLRARQPLQRRRLQERCAHAHRQ
jgi:hypothetical protein